MVRSWNWEMDLDSKCVNVENHGNIPGPYHINWHQHDFFELLYILRGTRKVFVDNLRLEASSGDLIVFRPGQAHSEHSGTKRISFICLRFNQRQLDKLPVEFPDSKSLPCVTRLPQRERISNLLGRMIEEVNGAQSFSHTLIQGYLTEFIVLLRRAVCPNAALLGASKDAHSGNGRVQVSLELMEHPPACGTSIEAIAKKSFMSVSHFTHVFKKTTGESPKSFLIRQRISRAKELLRATDHSASEIAATLDYETPSYFYRQFKKNTGMTTGEFRAHSRDSAEK